MNHLTSPPVSPEYLLQDVDKEYDDELESLSSLRLRNMKKQLNILDSQYQDALHNIDERTEARIHTERREICNQQNVNRRTEELKRFESIKHEREQLALKQSQQTVEQLRLLADMKKKLDEMKKARFEKTRAIGKLLEHVKDVFGNIKSSYKTHKEILVFPEAYELMVRQIVSEYTSTSKLIGDAMEDNTTDLEEKFQLISQKCNFIDETSKKCHQFVKKLMEEKEEAEKQKHAVEEAAKKKAAEEAKKKAEDAAKQALAQKTAETAAPKVQPTTNSTTSATTAASNPSRSVPPVAEAVPSLVPLSEFMRQDIQMFTSRQSFDSYLILRKLLLDTEKQHQPLSTSKEQARKTYKFDLYKVVNTQINAISDESPKHLMEKILNLNTLLTQGEVAFSGKNVTAKGDPAALVSCLCCG